MPWKTKTGIRTSIVAAKTRPGDLADVLAAAEHHEQRAAVDEHLIGDRDHGRRPGEGDRGADMERRSLAPADVSGPSTRRPTSDRQRDAPTAAATIAAAARSREATKSSGTTNTTRTAPSDDQQQRVAVEPAGAGADAAQHIGDAVRSEADDERGR